MKQISLTPEEKSRLLPLLSRRPMIGGWYLIAMGVFVVGLMGWIIARQLPDTAEVVGGLIPLAAVFIGPGIWLLRRKHAYRRWLDEPVHATNGRLLNITATPYSGYRLTVELIDENGRTQQATFGIIGKSPWQLNDEIALLLWEDGRFCPRHPQQMTDFGYLRDRPRAKQRQRWLWTALALFLLCAGVGMAIGFLSQ